MTHLVAPLELLITKDIKSIGIGDGGNEVGMGKVYDSVCNSKNIPNASNIACEISTDYLIVASVSNWGGYALAAAVASLSTINYNDNIKFKFKNKEEAINKCLPSTKIEKNILKRLIESGARDGLTGKQEMMVDGMPINESIKVLDDIKYIIS